jgi:hypothetical protein
MGGEEAAVRSTASVLLLSLSAILLTAVSLRAGDPTFEDCMGAADAAISKADWPAAEAQVASAVRLAEAFPAEDARLDKALDRLVFISLMQKNFAAVESLSRRRLAAIEKLKGPDHPDVLPPLRGLFLGLTKQGKLEEAEKVGLRTLALVEKTEAADSVKVAVALENVAKVLRDLKREGEAAPLEERAKAIREKPKATKKSPRRRGDSQASPSWPPKTPNSPMQSCSAG